jgi:hypothetical protein
MKSGRSPVRPRAAATGTQRDGHEHTTEPGPACRRGRRPLRWGRGVWPRAVRMAGQPAASRQGCPGARSRSAPPAWSCAGPRRTGDRRVGGTSTAGAGRGRAVLRRPLAAPRREMQCPATAWCRFGGTRCSERRAGGRDAARLAAHEALRPSGSLSDRSSARPLVSRHTVLSPRHGSGLGDLR